MARTENEIRAEIKRYKVKLDRDTEWQSTDFFDGYLSALEWALSGSPAPVAGDDEIARVAHDLASVGCGCDEGEADNCRYMRDDYCRKLADNIEGALRAARAGAEAEIAALRAALAKAEEAMHEIAACERHTRSGGATAADLEDYEVGLDAAVAIAAYALAEIRKLKEPAP